MVVKSPWTPGIPHMARVHPRGGQLLTSAPSAGPGCPSPQHSQAELPALFRHCKWSSEMCFRHLSVLNKSIYL